jgi:putative ABC transport system substrate-binding protein
MNRRDTMLALLAFGVVPFPAEAQPRGKVYRIGVLDTTPAALNALNMDAFRQGLRELGYVEGQNLEIVYRASDGRNERFADLASELVRLKVDLILTRGTPAAVAAKSASRTIPVVMAASGNPVDAGVVASLGRPGGNVTGLSAQMADAYAKRLELLKELLPNLKRIAALCNMSNPAIPGEWKVVEASARSLGVEPQLLDVRRSEELGRAFDAAAEQRADAIVVWLDGLLLANRQPIIERAAKQRLPAIYASVEFVDAGGLISYGVSYPHLYRKAASYVDRIFKGAKPADLPIEQPTQFELAINLKTAKALGITVPRSILLRADRVME